MPKNITQYSRIYPGFELKNNIKEIQGLENKLSIEKDILEKNILLSKIDRLIGLRKRIEEIIEWKSMSKKEKKRKKKERKRYDNIK